MAILKIARMGHPILRRRAHEVADPTAPEIERLVADMLETMRDAPGTGLAAPQVHVPLRVVIFEIAEARAERENAEPVPVTVLINPVVEPIGDDVVPTQVALGRWHRDRRRYASVCQDRDPARLPWVDTDVVHARLPA